MHPQIRFAKESESARARHIFATKLALIAGFVLTVFSTQAMQGQTFEVIYKFSGPDGANPHAGVTVGGPGILYGTTYYGGKGSGVAYELKKLDANWSSVPLYAFSGGNDGGNPKTNLTPGPDGTLFGTTQNGGTAGGGTVFRLTPRPTICKTVFCYLNEQVIWNFGFGQDGNGPAEQTLLFDKDGNLYGTATGGGLFGQGIAFKLTKSGNTWTETQRYDFAGGTGDAGLPESGLILDAAGNLYGVSTSGGQHIDCDGFHCGTVYQITTSGQSWTDKILHSFEFGADGEQPTGTLVMDSQGNLYGITSNGGGIFQLMPGSLSFREIYSPCYSYAGLTIDSAGSFYGVCTFPGFVFKLTYNGTWHLTDLHDFSGPDGLSPRGPVAIDSSGNLFGTTYSGGNSGCDANQGCGTVWEITGAAAPAASK